MIITKTLINYYLLIINYKVIMKVKEVSIMIATIFKEAEMDIEYAYKLQNKAKIKKETTYV